jgi:hypothetical protein
MLSYGLVGVSTLVRLLSSKSGGRIKRDFINMPNMAEQNS